MNRKIIVVFILLISLLLNSCMRIENDYENMLLKPDSITPPLSGVWNVIKYINNPKEKFNTSVYSYNFNNKQALFHKNGMIFSDIYAVDPKYKTRIINLDDYLDYNYGLKPIDLQIKDKKVEIITVFNNDETIINEFVKYDDNTLIINLKNNFCFLNKSSDYVSLDELHRHIEIEKNLARMNKYNVDNEQNIGVILGLKSSFTNLNGEKEYNYSSLWIGTNNKKVSEVYEVNKLLLPRNKGFWTIDVNRAYHGRRYYDIIKCIPLYISEYTENKYNSRKQTNHMVLNLELGNNIIDKISADNSLSTSGVFNLERINIRYLGNDYISYEAENIETDEKTLKVLPLDNIRDNISLNLDYFTGNNLNYYFPHKFNGHYRNENNPRLYDDNFALSRKNGYWILIGRVLLDNIVGYEDFIINAFPPKSLVSNDSLSITWNSIKSKVPDAIDAFSSPNGEVLIIRTKNNLLAYSLNNKIISEKEIARIELDENVEIIMSEWASGRYTKHWKEEIEKNNASILNF